MLLLCLKEGTKSNTEHGTAEQLKSSEVEDVFCSAYDAPLLSPGEFDHDRELVDSELDQIGVLGELAVGVLGKQAL